MGIKKRFNLILPLLASIILFLHCFEAPFELLIGTHFAKDISWGMFVKIIFFIAWWIAYFYLGLYFRSIKEKRIERLLYTSVLISFFSMIITYVPYNNIIIVGVMGMLYLFEIALVVIWGLNILYLKNNVDIHIPFMKIFVISLFVSLFINFIGIAIFSYLGKVDRVDWLLILYSAPYFLMGTFFWRLRNKEINNS